MPLPTQAAAPPHLEGEELDRRAARFSVRNRPSVVVQKFASKVAARASELQEPTNFGIGTLEFSARGGAGRASPMFRLLAHRLQISDEIVARRHVEHAHRHAGTGYEFLWIGQPTIQIIPGPDQTGALERG